MADLGSPGFFHSRNRQQTQGTTQPMRGQMLDFDQLNGVIGTPDLLEQATAAYARDRT